MTLSVELFKACCGSVSKMATFASLDPQGGQPTKTVIEYLARHNVTIEELRAMYSEALQKGPYMLELALQDSEGFEPLLAPVAEECGEEPHSIRDRVVQVCQKIRTTEAIEELATSLDNAQLQAAFQEVGLGNQVLTIPPTLTTYLSKLTGLKPTDAALIFLVEKSMLFHAMDYQFRSLFVNDSRMKILAMLNSHTKMKLRLNSIAKQITAKEKQKSQLGAGTVKESQVLADEITLFQKSLQKMTTYFDSQTAALETLQTITDTLEQQISPEILEKVKELAVIHAKGKKDSTGDAGDILDTVEEVSRLTKQAIEFLGADRIEFSHSLLAPVLENQKPKIDKALTLFEKIPNTHNQKPVFANRLGVILNAMGSPDKAAEYFRRALLLPTCQDRCPIESNLFHARLNQGSFDAALKYMLQSIKGGNEECSLFDIERYVPKQILGVGGMGVTFLCEDVYEKRMAVVKTLWRFATGGLHETFAEAFMAKKMDNPHIIKIYDIGRHRANRPFIVMEYCTGIDLQQYIQKQRQGQPLEVEEALNITLEIAKGLLVAHQQNPPIIHRDIKPSNILYHPENHNVKIIDFGIACMLPKPEEISRSTTRNSGSVIAKNIAGTWGYMAPEQQRGEQNLTPRCDVFSLGKLLMFLLTSKTPPPENTFALKPQIRESVGELVGYCLMPHEADRYTTEQIISKIQEIQINLHKAPIKGPFPSATIAEPEPNNTELPIMEPPAEEVLATPVEEAIAATPVEEAVVATPVETTFDATNNVEIMDPMEANPDMFGDSASVDVSPNQEESSVEQIPPENLVDATSVDSISDDIPVEVLTELAPSSKSSIGATARRTAPGDLNLPKIDMTDPAAFEKAPATMMKLPPSIQTTDMQATASSEEINGQPGEEMQSLFDSAAMSTLDEDGAEGQTNASDATSSFGSQSGADEVVGIEEIQEEQPQEQPLDGGFDLSSDNQEVAASDEQNTGYDEQNTGYDEQPAASDYAENTTQENYEQEEMTSSDMPASSNVDYGDEWLKKGADMDTYAVPQHTGILVKEEDGTDNYCTMRRTLPLVTEQITLPPGYHWEGELAICDKDGATMIYIPRGAFTMGHEGNANEAPVRDVILDAYFIDECPVTWIQYEFFCRETKRPLPPREFDDLDESQPVVNITWEDAAAYAAWATKNLPTEAQWEKAAKGGIFFDGDETMMQKNKEPQRRYAWGNELPNDGNQWRANYESEPEFGMRSPSAMKRFPLGLSPYGCVDMCGNVWEWCSDWYDENAYKNASSTNPRGPKTGKGRVIRGGAWNSSAEKITTTFRSWMEPDVYWNVIGFRTIRNLMISASPKK